MLDDIVLEQNTQAIDLVVMNLASTDVLSRLRNQISRDSVSATATKSHWMKFRINLKRVGIAGILGRIGVVGMTSPLEVVIVWTSKLAVPPEDPTITGSSELLLAESDVWVCVDHLSFVKVTDKVGSWSSCNCWDGHENSVQYRTREEHVSPVRGFEEVN
jgi:hypothetical protein